MKAAFCLPSFAAITILGLMAYPASAELPPGTYEMLKSEAKEVLQLEVTKVTRLGDEEAQKDPEQRFLCEAKITGIDRSASEQAVGNTILFETYYIAPSDRNGFVGPAIPPKVPVGWRGKIYLNPMTDESATQGETPVYELAAYGQSFVASKTRALRQNTRRGFRLRRSNGQ